MPRPLHRRRLNLAPAALAVGVLGLTSAAHAQSLPTGWSLTDVGGAATPGSANLSAGTFSISSGGWDVDGPSDQFTFVSTPASGDVSLIARVTDLQNTDSWSLAGLMIRQSLDPGSTQASVFITPANGLVVRARGTAGGGTVQLTVGSGAAPIWLRLDRRFSTVKTYRSADGLTWTPIASVSIPLNASVVVGLAVASHSASSTVASSIAAVSLNGIPIPPPAPVPGNTPPSVSLTSPVGGSTFTAPATIAMAATAADSDGSIARVDFYANTTRIGSDTTSPYTISVSKVPAGSYVLKAVATDNVGATATSSTVSVTVNANKPPQVSLTSPLTGTSFTAPATIALAATASDADGSIQKVDFYNGTTLLGSSSISPYTFTWQNVAAGSYSVNAVARDNLGATATTPSSEVTVNAATPQLSTAVFSPAIVPDTIDYYVFEVFAAGADPSSAPPVASQNLGLPAVLNGECSANVGATLAALAPGNYIATVSSVSGAEGKLRSEPFSFSR